MNGAIIQDLYSSGLLIKADPQRGRLGDSVKNFRNTFTKLSLAAGATSDVQITILSGSDFIVTHGVGMVLNNSTQADLQWHPITIELSDPSENMQNTALPFWHVFGHPVTPIAWAGYALLKANSTVICSFTNNHSSTTVDIYATLLGLRRWRVGQGN